MKKNLIFGISIIFVSCFISSGLYAQSSNTERRIIGTWACNNETGYTWIFSADGKLTYNRSGSSGSSEYRYSVVDTKLVFMVEGVLQIYDIYLSSDGTTLILMNGVTVRGWSDGGPGFPRNWFTKK